jgi:hypothetical protein
MVCFYKIYPPPFRSQPTKQPDSHRRGPAPWNLPCGLVSTLGNIVPEHEIEAQGQYGEGRGSEYLFLPHLTQSDLENEGRGE